MKKNKTLSVLLSGILTVSLLSSISATAEENKIYTYSELVEMSDEEFLELLAQENKEYYYEEVKGDAEYYEEFFGFDFYGGLSGRLSKIIDNENDYTANETEMRIQSVLGNTVNYTIRSPISVDKNYLEQNGIYYGNILYVSFPDLNFNAEYQDIPNEAIISMTKCWYCVDQVFDIHYEACDTLLSSSDDEQVLQGDVNFDRAVNMSDLVHMSKLNVSYYKSTDAQNIIGDLNNDGNMNTLDLCMLCEHLIGNYELI